MRKAVSTVGVVTTDGPGGRFGLTVSAMSSVTIEPPLILVCIHSGSPVVAAVERNRTYCVNLLGEGQVHISEAFAGRHLVAHAHRFAWAEWTPSSPGVQFYCRLRLP